MGCKTFGPTAAAGRCTHRRATAPASKIILSGALRRHVLAASAVFPRATVVALAPVSARAAITIRPCATPFAPVRFGTTIATGSAVAA